jgi:hypothetical protein
MEHIRFFIPVIKISQDGLYIFKRKKSIPWNKIIQIVRLDGPLWGLTRMPLGLWLYFETEKPLWLNSRISRKECPLTPRWRLWNVYRTKDYEYVIEKIIKNSNLLSSNVSITTKKTVPYYELIKIILLIILFGIVVYIVRHILGR